MRCFFYPLQDDDFTVLCVDHPTLHQDVPHLNENCSTSSSKLLICNV